MIFFDRRGVAGGGSTKRAVNGAEVCAPAKGFVRPAIVVLSGALLLFATACQDPVRQAEAYALQAQALADAGDNKGALEAIQRAVVLRDDNASYFLLLGSYQMRANDPVGGFTAFRRALELDAANVTALNFVANIGLQIGQVDEAERAADRLLTLNPRSVVALQVKGLTALFRGRLDEAESYAAKILAISPSDEAGTIIRVRSLVNGGKPEEALETIDRTMIVSGRTPALLITKLNAHRVLRQPQQMIAIYKELMPQVGGQSPTLRLDQINLLYKMGDTANARTAGLAFLEGGSSDPTDYRTLLRIWAEFDPTPFDRETIRQARKWADPLASIAVGRYLIWQQQYQIASDLNFALRPGIQPLFSALRARAQDGLEREAAKAGRRVPMTSKELLDVIIRADPDDADAQIMVAINETRAGRMNLAMEAAQKAVSIDPNDPEVYVALAGVNHQVKDDRRARQIYEDGLKQLPQSFLLIENYTRFLHELGDKSRAVSVTRAFARAVPSANKAWALFAAQCRWTNDAVCLAEAEKGQANAQTSYRLDDPPGAPTNRGLLGQF